MNRQIDDQAYINYLPSDMYRKRYFRWKEEMLSCLEELLQSLDSKSLDDVMSEWNLTPKDIALLVRLKYVTDEEADKFGLKEIEKTVSS